jgi:hypothetical protein
VQIFTWLMAGAAVVVVLRMYFALRRVRRPEHEDWDEMLVKNLRAQGSDPFREHDIDFFFDLPDEAACAAVAAQLAGKGYGVDFRRVDPDRGDRYTLHATRQMRLAVQEMQALRIEFDQLAAGHAGRYDGWATAGITRAFRSASAPPRQRP